MFRLCCLKQIYIDRLKQIGGLFIFGQNDHRRGIFYSCKADNWRGKSPGRSVYSEYVEDSRSSRILMCVCVGKCLLTSCERVIQKKTLNPFYVNTIRLDALLQYNNSFLQNINKWTQIRLTAWLTLEGLGWASLNTGLHSSVVVMIDLRGSSANTENLLRIHSRPANKLKETVQMVKGVILYFGHVYFICT